MRFQLPQIFNHPEALKPQKPQSDNRWYGKSRNARSLTLFFLIVTAALVLLGLFFHMRNIEYTRDFIRAEGVVVQRESDGLQWVELEIENSFQRIFGINPRMLEQDTIELLLNPRNFDDVRVHGEVRDGPAFVWTISALPALGVVINGVIYIVARKQQSAKK
ncbi:MAG: hypothetical protein FWB98_01595 [Defluviitaleaceae bacterium]|nr:hypothetical protein [Defluviitaleaceae bacterium]